MAAQVYGPYCAHNPRPLAARAYGDKLLAHFTATWGTGEALNVWFDGPGPPPEREVLQRLERYTFKPRGVVELMRRNFEIDVRPVLPVITAPTLVVHTVGDGIILAWAIVFGYAQQLFTRLVDQQAHAVLNDTRSGKRGSE